MRARRRVRVIFGVGAAVLLSVVATTAIQAQRADSIKVHGHWTIDVRNRDGSLASHNEIENELVPTGTSALTGLLAGNYQTPTWRILLGSAADAGPCVRNMAPPPTTPLSSLVIMPPETVVTNAPRFILGDSPHSPDGSSFQWQFNAGESLAFDLETLAPNVDSTISVGPGEPSGFAMGPITWEFPLQSSSVFALIHFTFDSSAATPGDYTFPITADRLGIANVYMVTIHLVAPQPPDPGLSEPYPCSAVAPGTTIPYELANAWFPTVGVAVVDAAPGQNLELSGNVTVAFAQPIDHVNSIIVVGNAALGFSARTLQTPIQVAVGQKIYVKVAFSFS